MVKVASFVALNVAQSDVREEETQEARESRLISLYEQALRSLQRREPGAAKVRQRAPRPARREARGRGPGVAVLPRSRNASLRTLMVQRIVSQAPTVHPAGRLPRRALRPAR